MNENNPQFLFINKPTGWTSFDAVAFIRKKLRQKNPENKKIKVGHAGTLDPFATGLLIIGVGREATKKLDEFKKLPKTYITTIELGAVSDTYDITGKIIYTPNSKQSIDQNIIEKIIQNFIGPQKQIPPMYSAKKINGKKLYELARQGKIIERQSTPIEIYDIKLLEYTWPILKIEVNCSAGTYIRSLAHDIGQKLGTGAYCVELIRTAIGGYTLEQAQNLSTLRLDKQSSDCQDV
jgi:tRNA pseudouridine55 synthase